MLFWSLMDPPPHPRSSLEKREVVRRFSWKKKWKI